MPRYTVATLENRFSQDQKSALAQTITKIHCSYTHAPSYFVQVVFNEVKAANYFDNGKIVTDDSIFIQGQIRAGLPEGLKKEMLMDFINQCAAIAETDPSSLEMYLTEIPAHQMTELGVILEEFGQDKEWEAKLPQGAKNKIQRKIKN